MSHEVFKSFSIKDGKARICSASSNTFTWDNCRAFHDWERPFFPESAVALEHYGTDKGRPALDRDGNTQPNEHYGFSDRQLYVWWMMHSTQNGDRYYQERHKAVMRLCEDYMREKTSATGIADWWRMDVRANLDECMRYISKHRRRYAKRAHTVTFTKDGRQYRVGKVGKRRWWFYPAESPFGKKPLMLDGDKMKWLVAALQKTCCNVDVACHDRCETAEQPDEAQPDLFAENAGGNVLF